MGKRKPRTINVWTGFFLKKIVAKKVVTESGRTEQYTYAFAKENDSTKITIVVLDNPISDLKQGKKELDFSLGTGLLKLDDFTDSDEEARTL